MKFEDFEASFIRENRKLKWWFAVITVCLIGLLVLNYMKNTFFIYQGGEIFEERLLAEDVCKEGFLSIVQNSPSKYFVTKGILDILTKEPFKIELEKLLYLKSAEIGKCRIIIQSKGRLRSFIVTLTERTDYPFAYKINQIDEIETQEELYDFSHSD